MAAMSRRVSVSAFKKNKKTQLTELIAIGPYPASGVVIACDRVVAARAGATV